MEREKELAKLINVLRRTSRMALQAEWTGGKEDSAEFCTDQYNRVLTRLKEIDPGIGVIFEPLPAGSSLTVVAMAARQLAAYYEDEVEAGKGFGGHGFEGWSGFGRRHRGERGGEGGREEGHGGGGRVYGFSFDPSMFREFWEKSAREVEDIGEFIRESIEEWLRQKKTSQGEKETSNKGTSGKA